MVKDRNDQHRTNTEAACHGGVDARVGFGVDAKLRLASAETSAREVIACIEGNAEIGSVESGSGAPNHFAAARKGQGSRTGACGINSSHDQYLEDEIEREVSREACLDLLLENAGQSGLVGEYCSQWFGLGLRDK